MMHITIIAVGRLKERFWSQACDEYLKRLGAYASVEIRELPDVDPTRAGGESKACEQESTSILQAIPITSIPILLDIKGKEMTSESIAGRIERFGIDGVNDVCLIIGGSCGVDDSVRNGVRERWSLGRITLPHNLARVVLLEQIYRAFKIMRREPYHK